VGQEWEYGILHLKNKPTSRIEYLNLHGTCGTRVHRHMLICCKRKCFSRVPGETHMIITIPSREEVLH